jgi:hypothetical protein
MTPQEKFFKQWLDKEIELLKEELKDNNRLLLEKIEQIEKDVYTTKVIVAGNGDPSKSLVVRFDRLEQTAERSTWFTRTAMGTSIAAIVGLGGYIIKHFFFP